MAALAEFFGVRTAWHGPGDVSPVGHAAGMALELSTHNFGIHEGGTFPTASAHSCAAWVVWRDGVRLDILDSVLTIS